jgi:hypothetical protein
MLGREKTNPNNVPTQDSFKKDLFPDVNVLCLIDGVKVDSMNIHGRTVRKGKGYTFTTSATPVQTNEFRRYRFAPPVSSRDFRFVL